MPITYHQAIDVSSAGWGFCIDWTWDLFQLAIFFPATLILLLPIAYTLQGKPEKWLCLLRKQA